MKDTLTRVLAAVGHTPNITPAGEPACSPAALYDGRRVVVSPLGIETLKAQQAFVEVNRVLHACFPGTENDDLTFLPERMEWLSRLDPPLEIGALIQHRPTETPLGFAFLSAIDRRNAKAELSLAFFRGRGSRAALEAVHWLLEAALFHFPLEKLVFHVLPENKPAHALLARLGISEEALLRQEIQRPDGTRTDLVRYALFASEWKNSPARAGLQRCVPLKE